MIEELKSVESVNDLELPHTPKLEIYKETFCGIENITEDWYKNNRE